MAGGLRRAPQTRGDVAVRAFLDHAELQQLAIPLRERRERSTVGLRERPTVVDRFESGVLGKQTRHAEPAAGGVFDPPLPQGLAQDVPRDPEQPRQRRRVALVPEPLSRQPGSREDLGRQVGRMLADPRPRPCEHLGGVPVVDLLERIGSPCPQEFSIRCPSEFDAHNL